MGVNMRCFRSGFHVGIVLEKHLEVEHFVTVCCDFIQISFNSYLNQKQVKGGIANLFPNPEPNNSLFDPNHPLPPFSQKA